MGKTRMDLILLRLAFTLHELSTKIVVLPPFRSESNKRLRPFAFGAANERESMLLNTNTVNSWVFSQS
jgi:hypothetical protein